MTFVPDARQWVAVDAPLRSVPGDRSPYDLRRLLAQFDVERSARYQPTGSATFCNIYVWDATRALGCEIPHWLENPKRELNANAVCDWLEFVGPKAGWQRVAAQEAADRASAGYPVVAAWKNPGIGSGHVAMLLPSDGGELRIAQAGRKNLFDAPIANGFGRHRPRFYVHD